MDTIGPSIIDQCQPWWVDDTIDERGGMSNKNRNKKLEHNGHNVKKSRRVHKNGKNWNIMTKGREGVFSIVCCVKVD